MNLNIFYCFADSKVYHNHFPDKTHFVFSPVDYDKNLISLLAGRMKFILKFNSTVSWR